MKRRPYVETPSSQPSRSRRVLRGALPLADRKEDKGVAVVLWETAADMLASEAGGFYQEQIAKFAAVFAEEAVREHYEVGVQV